MKSPVVFALACLACTASLAHAQLGGLENRLKHAQEAKEKVDQTVGEIRI